MTVINIYVKDGRGAALKALGETLKAFEVQWAEEYIKSVLENEGVMPFNERPKDTKDRLNEANRVIYNAEDLLWEKRHEEVE